jgi:hypothetical protein
MSLVQIMDFEGIEPDFLEVNANIVSVIHEKEGYLCNIFSGNKVVEGVGVDGRGYLIWKIEGVFYGFDLWKNLKGFNKYNEMLVLENSGVSADGLEVFLGKTITAYGKQICE